MKHFFPILLFLIIIVSSCRERRTEIPPLCFGTELYDSSALHVALMPNRDCLPIYYAVRRGLYDSLGVKVQIATFRSQLDLDTALLGNVADGGWADSRRLRSYGKRASDLRTMWSEETVWALVVNGSLRVKEIKNLAGRTIAYTRDAVESDLLERFISKGGLKMGDIFRPQINDCLLRAEMVCSGQVDGAVLAWPYTSYTTSGGHRVLAYETTTSTASFVMKRSALRSREQSRRWQLFEQGRRMAIDSLRKKGAEAYSLILQKDYGLPKEVADTVKY